MKSGSVDPDHNFKMLWEVDPKAQKRLNDIAKAVKGADKLILATDPDREGEAISWHVLEFLKEKKALSKQTIERVVFNAITKQAVTEAMAHPRIIDQALVDAYLARRALDYLVGFTLSPVLWRKLPGARSAGRVQSVALRLVCDRELEIEKFVRQEYWSLVATLATPRDETFEARLVGADGKKLQRLDIGSRRGGASVQAGARNRDLHRCLCRRQTGEAASATTVHHLDAAADGHAASSACAGPHHAGGAAALWKASTSAAKAVSPCTCMRTDGVQIAPEVISAMRTVIASDCGARAMLPSAPHRCEAKAKNAQESPRSDPADRPRLPTRARPRSVLDTDQAGSPHNELIWLRARSPAKWNPPSSSAPRSRSPPMSQAACSTCAPPAPCSR